MRKNNIQYCPYLRLVVKDQIDPQRNHPPKYQRVLLDYELFYVCSGSGRSVIGGKTYELKPQHLYLIRPGVGHYHEFDSLFDFYYLHMDLFYSPQRENSFIVPWGHALNKNERKLMQYDIATIMDIPYGVESPLPSQTVEQFERLLDIYHEASAVWRLRSQGILAQLIEGFITLDQDRSDDASLQKRLQRSVVFMRNNLHQHLSLTIMAEAAHLSRYYFARQFKQQYQVTPAHYHMQLRLESAAYRLRNSSDSVQLIAENFGFKTPFHFSRCFKQRYKFSPRSYRQTQG